MTKGSLQLQILKAIPAKYRLHYWLLKTSLFWKRGKFIDARMKGVIMHTAFILKSQQHEAGDYPIEDNIGRVSIKSLGYIYGCVDAALYIEGIDKDKEYAEIPIIYHCLHYVLALLSPGKEHKHLGLIVENINNSDEMREGAAKGGVEYCCFMKGERHPLGFAVMLVAHAVNGNRALRKEQD
jgi:hypothetical protein